MSDMLGNIKMGMYGNTLRLFGLSSSFDTQSLLDAELQIMQLQNTPFKNQQGYITQEKTAWNNFKTFMGDFTTKVEALKDVTSASKKVTNSDTDAVNVSATSGSLDGNYNISVQNIATNHKIMSNGQGDAKQPLGYEGTVMINKLAFNFTKDMSLSDVATKVNEGNYGINAVIIGGNLVFTAKKTGLSNQIQFEDTIGTKTTVSSSNPTAIGAKVIGTTADGNNSYQIEVKNLLQGQKSSATSAANWSDYSGNFTINQGSNTLTIDLKKEDGTSKTESEIIDEINNAGFGVKASIVSGNLQLDSATKGAASAFTVTDNTTSSTGTQLFTDIGLKEDIAAKDAEYTVDGVTKTSSSETVTDAISGLELSLNEVTTSPVTISTSSGSAGILENLGFIDSMGNVNKSNEVQAALDANFTIDGIKITRSTNSVSDAVAGVTFDLIKPTTTPARVEITQDNDLLKTKVQDFVTAYNQTINYINQYTAKQAVLQGQTIPTRAKMDMGMTLMKDTPSDLMLYQIGVSIDGTAKDGTVTFDSTKLDEQLEKDPDGVLKLLTGKDGIAGILYEKMNELVKTSGTVDTKIDSLTKRYDDLQKTIDKNQEMFDKQQDTLLNKYSQFESIMGTLSVQQQYMDAQVKAMQNSNN